MGLCHYFKRCIGARISAKQISRSKRFSPNSVSTLRGSHGKGKDRCLIEVLTLGRGIFLVNFLHKMALVTCPGVFRLRRLAQSLPREFCFRLGRGIFPVNSRIKWPFCFVTSKCISIVQACTKRAPNVWGAPFSSAINHALFDCAGLHRTGA